MVPWCGGRCLSCGRGDSQAGTVCYSWRDALAAGGTATAGDRDSRCRAARLSGAVTPDRLWSRPALDGWLAPGGRAARELGRIDDAHGNECGAPTQLTPWGVITVAMNLAKAVCPQRFRACL